MGFQAAIYQFIKASLAEKKPEKRNEREKKPEHTTK